MQSFQDRNETRWLLDLTLADVRQIEATHGICLLAPTDEQFASLLDPALALDIIWQLCEAQAREEPTGQPVGVGIDRTAWERRINGDALEAALTAFWTECAGFFRTSPTLIQRWLQAMHRQNTPPETAATTSDDSNPATRGTPSTAAPESSAATGDP